MKQTRFIAAENCGLRVRESADASESRTIEGTPIVFGVRSVNLTPWSESRVVYEVLEPGCIDAALLRQSDVVLNLNHSSLVPDVLGRCRFGKGTLSLELAADHVGCNCELPHTHNADDALELMRRGDITGMSFAFEDDWEDTENGVSYERTGEVRDGKEVWLRHVKRITALYDVAIVTHPAYEQTSVATREQHDIDQAIEAQLLREAPAQAAADSAQGAPDEAPAIAEDAHATAEDLAEALAEEEKQRDRTRNMVRRAHRIIAEINY